MSQKRCKTLQGFLFYFDLYTEKRGTSSMHEEGRRSGQRCASMEEVVNVFGVQEVGGAPVQNFIAIGRYIYCEFWYMGSKNLIASGR